MYGVWRVEVDSFEFDEYAKCMARFLFFGRTAKSNPPKRRIGATEKA